MPAVECSTCSRSVWIGERLFPTDSAVIAVEKLSRRRRLKKCDASTNQSNNFGVSRQRFKPSTPGKGPSWFVFVFFGLSVSNTIGKRLNVSPWNYHDITVLLYINDWWPAVVDTCRFWQPSFVTVLLLLCLSLWINNRDVKRGQTLKAEAEAKTSRPRPNKEA